MAEKDNFLHRLSSPHNLSDSLVPEAVNHSEEIFPVKESLAVNDACTVFKPPWLSGGPQPDMEYALKYIQAGMLKLLMIESDASIFELRYALGDHSLKPHVSGVPEVSIVRRTTRDEFVNVASEGLWDVISSLKLVSFCGIVSRDEARRRIRGPEHVERAAAKLVEVAISKGSTDNVSAVAVVLKA